MKVEAHDMQIENLFKKGRFVIPDYQREYDWEDEHINELLEDIDEILVNDNYFIGHMVFEGEFNGNEFIVVDGQQRITTITILLCVIRDLFINLGEVRLAEAIHTSYIFGKDKSYNDFAVLENRMPYPVLQAYVQSKPIDKDSSVTPQKSGEKKIINAYNLIQKNFTQFNKEQLIELRDKILGLEVIFVAASDQVDASTIFMTINATGKDLSPLDLVKNHIFSLYPKLPHIDEPNDSWKHIIENTSGSVKFLNNFFASRYKKVSDKRIFREFLKTIKIEGKEKIKDFLLNLKNDAELFRMTIKPKASDWVSKDYDIFESISATTIVFKIEVANSFIISLLREYKSGNISKEMTLKALRIIERFHFINNAVCSNRSSGFDKMYAKKAKNLFEAPNREKKHIVIQSLIKDLNEKIPSTQLFTSNFDKKLYYLSTQTKQKQLVQYALNKIERKRNLNAVLINTSIEHIYPEKHNNWVGLKDNNLIQNIGNLTLLDSGLNSKIGNKIYTDKQSLIKQHSKILSTKDIFEKYDDWRDDQILERKELLMDELYRSVWI